MLGFGTRPALRGAGGRRPQVRGEQHLPERPSCPLWSFLLPLPSSLPPSLPRTLKGSGGMRCAPHGTRRDAPRSVLLPVLPSFPCVLLLSPESSWILLLMTTRLMRERRPRPCLGAHGGRPRRRTRRRSMEKFAKRQGARERPCPVFLVSCSVCATAAVRVGRVCAVRGARLGAVSARGREKAKTVQALQRVRVLHLIFFLVGCVWILLFMNCAAGNVSVHVWLHRFTGNLLV